MSATGTDVAEDSSAESCGEARGDDATGNLEASSADADACGSAGAVTTSSTFDGAGKTNADPGPTAE